jgi:hypothetical protein
MGKKTDGGVDNGGRKLAVVVNHELEIRFFSPPDGSPRPFRGGGGGGGNMTRRDFERIAVYLRDAGWRCDDPTGQHLLRVGVHDTGLRLELNGSSNINAYLHEDEFLSPAIGTMQVITEKNVCGKKKRAAVAVMEEEEEEEEEEEHGSKTWTWRT